MSPGKDLPCTALKVPLNFCMSGFVLDCLPLEHMLLTLTQNKKLINVHVLSELVKLAIGRIDRGFQRRNIKK